MTTVRLLLAISLGLLLAACSSPFKEGFYEREFSAYLPSEDPLVVAYFEQALNDNGLAYRRDADGRFSVLDHTQDDELEELASEFAGKVIPKRMIPVERGCAAQAMQTYLRREDVIYVVVLDENNGALLQMSEADFIQHEIEERWTAFQQACDETAGS
ncbi:MAG: hypothetical protein Hals2KO_04560 [Halioglobus sp.]